MLCSTNDGICPDTELWPDDIQVVKPPHTFGVVVLLLGMIVVMVVGICVVGDAAMISFRLIDKP